jgi:hypothetical protein
LFGYFLQQWWMSFPHCGISSRRPAHVNQITDDIINARFKKSLLGHGA